MGELRIVSVNVGREEPLTIGKRATTSGIHKRAVSGTVAIGPLGIGHDAVIDTKHHGGADQAVYVYRQEDYDWWRAELGRDVAPGSFGDNLTVAGLGQNDLHHGAGMAMTVTDQASHQIFARGTRNGIFTGGIDLADTDHVGFVEAGTKVVK